MSQNTAPETTFLSKINHGGVKLLPCVSTLFYCQRLLPRKLKLSTDYLSAQNLFSVSDIYFVLNEFRLNIH